MEIGLVGKPNVGKSTFFSAATKAPTEIGNYPFTTIEPKKGVAGVRFPCPHVALGLPQCDPKNAPCVDGTRWVPVELIDVAGLVKGAHEGRGLGNKFLDDLRQASCLLHIIDAAGATDAEGQPAPLGTGDPAADAAMLEAELEHWILGILTKGGWPAIARRVESGQAKLDEAVHERLSGLGVAHAHVVHALKNAGLSDVKPTRWDDAKLLVLAREIRRVSKPMLVAGNKADMATDDQLARLAAFEPPALPTCANSELALRKAADAGVVRYTPGGQAFEVVDPGRLSADQTKGLEYIRTHVFGRFGGTGVQAAIEQAVYELLHLIVVFPVEDETHYKDGKGNVLPDAHLVPHGTTARGLAYRVHTDLGEHFIRAIDAKRKKVVGADHALQPGDVVRIVSKT